jgi:hypothetical protein
MGIANIALDGVWKDIATVCHSGVELETPAEKSTFTVKEVRADELVITLKSKETMRIGKAAFEGALSYLLAHGHHTGARCEIRSSAKYEDAGPLCRATRTNGTRNSTYVLPILKKMGLVDIDPGTSTRVSTAWYIA